MSLVNSKLYAIVDPADFYQLSQYAWLVCTRNESYRVLRLSMDGRRYQIISMHREVFFKEDTEHRTQNSELANLPGKFVIDHINRNGLDNRRANLRLATVAQNNMNRRARKGSSKYKGVHFRRDTKRYKARISVNGERIDLGCFDNETDAARAYDEAAKEYYGKYACLNFPPEQKQKGLKFVLRSAFCVLRIARRC